MSEKVGRNNLCPCGSGKKLKRCHVNWPPVRRQVIPADGPSFTVAPERVPEVVNHHVEVQDGIARVVPGTFLVQMVTVPIGSIDEETSNLIAKVARDLQTLAGQNEAWYSVLTSRLENVGHKLHAVKYHLDNYVQREEDKIANFRRDHGPPGGVSIHEKDPRLIYEVEAFLFQVKSALDLLERFVSDALRLGGRGFGDHGDDLIKRLERNAPKQLASIATEISTTVRAAQPSWIDESIRARDDVAHVSALKDFTCFVEDPYAGGGLATIHYPTMPNGQRTRDYLERTRRELLAFCEQLLATAARGASVLSAHD